MREKKQGKQFYSKEILTYEKHISTFLIYTNYDQKKFILHDAIRKKTYI